MADVLLWQRYDNKKMVAMHYYVVHFQQYSHRLNLYFYIALTLYVMFPPCVLSTVQTQK